jgi:basic amino acid/polyamine antiporter, APA family
MTAVAVFAIYFTLPAIALSALPVHEVNGEFTTLLGEPPENGGYANDPVLGVVKNLGIENDALLHGMEIYVGVLAATILLVATNAGVIGASRITYAMSSYRQLPEIFRRLHPRLRTPYVSLVVFAGIVPVIALLPGETDFLGTMYSFGAMLSFTVAHLSIIALRARKSDHELVYRGRPNLRFRGVDVPLFAVLGGLATGLAWLVIVITTPSTRIAGLGWLVLGFVAYTIYRKRLGLPLARTVRAPPLMLGFDVEYRTIVVPVVRSAETEEALVAAGRLVAERGGRVVVVHVLEVPLDQPIDADLPEAEDEADELLDQARTLVESYGVRVVERLVRGRSASAKIVEEAERLNADLVIVGAPRRRGGVSARLPVFGRTVDRVLKLSPCRVLVTAGKSAA